MEITVPRPNLALAAARASLACTRLFIAMHAHGRGCADCGYGFRSCSRVRLAQMDAASLAERVAVLEKSA